MMPERKRGKAEEGAECPRCERSARGGCVSTCDPLAQGSEGTSSAPPPSTSCWSPPPPPPLQPAPSAAPAATPASASARSSVDADLELYALQTHLTPEELQMLALLEMSGPLLRSECARCRLKAQQGAEQAQPEKDAGPPCICQTLADDHFFRDARAALARQLRELARRRMAAASVSSLSGDRVTGETFTTSSGDGCTRVPNRSESEFGDEWDWLTQMQACVPSPPAAREAMNGQPPAPQQMGSRPQFMAPRPPSEPVAPGSPGGWGGYSGSTHALHGGPFGGPQNFQSQQPFGQPFSPSPQQPPPPPPFGMGGTFGQVPGQTSFSAPSPGQGATYGQTPGQGGAGYGQAPGQTAAYGQPPGQGGAFGQQTPGQAGSYSAAGQGAGFGQTPGQGPNFGQSPGQGAGFGQPGQGGAYGQLGSGQTGQYLAQDPYMGGQFTANQYTGMTVQTGYSGPPGYGTTQPYAGGAQQQYPQAQFLPAQFQPAQFPGAPNQCTFAVQQPLQQFLSQQGPCGVPAFLPAAGQLCPHLLCGAQVCTGHPCAAPAPPAPPSPPPPPALQQYSEVTAKAQVEGASAAALLRRMTSTLPRQDAGEAATLGAGLASAARPDAASAAGAGAGAGAVAGCACSPLELSLKCCWRTPEGALAACERVITCTPRPPRPASAPANCLCLGVAVRDRRLVLWPHGAPAAPAAPPCGTCETSPPASAPAAPAPAPVPSPPAAPPPPPPPPPLPPPPAGMGAGAVRAGSVLPPPVTLNIGPWMP